MSDLQAHVFSTPARTVSRPSNWTDIWRPREFQALELQHASDVTVEYPRHWHDEFYVSVALGGTSYFDCAGRSYAIAEGEMVVVAPGEVHANQKIGCTCRTIFLDHSAFHGSIERFLERSIPAPDFRSGLLNDHLATQNFLAMHQLLEGPRFEMEQETSLFQFLSQLVIDHSAQKVSLSRPGNEDVAVQRAKQYLEEHYAERVLLQDLARLTRLSPFHFNRSFCQKVGMPPHAYQLQLRIMHARRFLRLGHSVSETACLVGFFDQSHFVHAFKRSEGTTPSQYVRFSKNLQDGKAHTLYFGC